MTVRMRESHMNCGNCKYSLPDDNDPEQVRCIWGPPAMVPTGDNRLQGFDHFCKRVGFCWQWERGAAVN